MDRFIIVEMDVLNDEEEFGLLQYMFPHVGLTYSTVSGDFSFDEN